MTTNKNPLGDACVRHEFGSIRVPSDAAVEAAARALHDAHGWDMEECREDAAAALMAAADADHNDKEQTT